MKRFRFLAIVLAIVIVLVPIEPAFAKQPDKIITDYEEAVEILEDYVSVSETGEFIIDAPNKVIKTIDSEVYQSVLLSMGQTNQMIDEGYLVSENDLEIIVTERYLDLTPKKVGGKKKNEDITSSPRMIIWDGGGGGSIPSTYYTPNSIEWYWWGFKLYLNNYTCIRIAAGLYVGAAICALLLEPLASKVVAIVMVSFAATITATNVYGRGVIISFFHMRLLIIPFSICSQ